MSEPSEYDKLRAEWYKKLKDEGYEDIESSETHLRFYSSTFAREKSLLSWEAKQAYYQMATTFLAENRFRSKLERIIWEYHANGMSGRDIAKTLEKVKIHINRMTVWRIVSRLEKKMKKKYLVGKS